MNAIRATVMTNAHQWTHVIAVVRTALAVSICSSLLVVSPTAAASLRDRFSPSSSEKGAVLDHSAFATLLRTYVVVSDDGVNRVRYAALKRDGLGALQAYIRSLEAVDVGTLGRGEQFAFWANLYNAKTLDIVAGAYPVASIRDISLGGGGLFGVFSKGPWKAKVVRVNNVPLSLDDIEHGIMRPLFGDPRVHYAVNCASIGCPNLRVRPFTSATLNADLESAAAAYVNHPRGVVVRDGSVTASSIYKWYGDDFGGTAQGLLRHFQTYAVGRLKTRLKLVNGIDRYTYDWSLNDAR